MIETSIKDLSVEEIMKKIQEEVKKREHSLLKKENIDNIKQETITIEDIQKTEYQSFIQRRANIFKVKDIYEYSDFTKYHDVEFVQNIYKGLLKREADQKGLEYYLNLLRSGEKSKSEIISLIRYSKEGRNKNVLLLGSKKRALQAILYKIPVIGYISKSLYVLFTLPKLLKRLNSLENYIAQEAIMSHHNDLLLEKAINIKADKSELERVAKELQANIETKADESKVDSIANELELKIETKADKSELERVAQELEANIETKADESKVDSITNKLELKIETKADKMDIVLENAYEEKLPSFLEFAIDRYGKSIELISKDEKSDLYYLLFENIFYEHNAVKEKQQIYVPYIKDLKISKKDRNWLDIGCGRGEFLEILTNNNILCEGVEINKVEYEELIEKGYKVSNTDAVTFLKNTQKTFKGISALQVIEHLEYDYLKEMLKLSYEKIEPNGMIILETINPRNLLGLANFYMDETHKRPLPAEMIAFLLEWIGFKDIKIVYSALLPDNFRNKQKNTNYHDYAVIGYKS